MNNYEKNYILGLDLGVGSIGWSCIKINDDKQPERIINANSFIFDEEEGSLEDRRVARGQRRLTRRRKNRLKYIRKLFLDYGLIEKDRMKVFFDKEACNYDDPYHIKVKGLSEKLTSEELLIALVHYGKSRGFKSNRKKDEKASNTKNASEDEKLLYAISQTEKEMQEKHQTISQYIINNPKFAKKIRNTDDDYHLGIKRSMIIDEATKLLDKQIEYGIIDSNFKDKYLDILEYQRSFSAGPTTGPYANPLQKMIGKCVFDGKERAPKNAPSYELFKMLQDLSNVRYNEYDDENKLINKNVKLTLEEKKLIIQEAFKNKDIKYKVIAKAINKDNINFLGINLVKKDYEKIKELKEKDPQKDDKLIRKEYILSQKSINNSKLYNYAVIKNAFKSIIKLDEKDLELMDQITVLLSKFKSDDEIKLNINKFDLIESKDDLFKSVIYNIDTKYMKDFGKLSLPIINKLNNLMLNEGLDYYEAMNSLGYDHSNQNSNDVIFDELPSMSTVIDDLDLSITNRKVLSTLKNAKQLINKIIKEYGKPYAIHVEMARDLTKNDKEKAKMMNESYMNQINKLTLKQEILNKYGYIFTSLQQIKYDDIVKYKLFKEQKGVCPYTLAKTGSYEEAMIDEKNLFSEDYEIDHIIPYSKCYNDREYDKILVKKQMNQEKRDRIPYEYFKESKGLILYKEWVNENIKSYRKRQCLLAEKITDEMKGDFSARAINDTRYISKALTKILKHYFSDIKIRVYNGQMTDKMKGIWGVKNLTHSYQSENYLLNDQMPKELEDKYNELSILSLNNEYYGEKAKELKSDILKLERERDKKNRSNHLHHALDATVIACLTDSLKIRVQQYEQYIRLVKEKGKYDDNVVLSINIEDPETGEITTEKKEVHSKHELFDLLKIEEDRFPKPYPEFSDEVKYRIFERDETLMKKRLSCLDNYSISDVQEAEVLQVAHKCNKKIQGRLHKDTIMGGAKNPNNTNEVTLTNRIDIASEKFTIKTLEKLYDKDKTQKQIYEKVKEWLGEYKNGSVAYAKYQGYPKSNNGNIIKKVKIDYGAPKEEILLHESTKQYVEKENVVRVDVYKKDGEDKLYFVGMDRYRCMNSNSNQNLMLWYGQGKNNIVVRKNELNNKGFNLYKQIYKNQLIKVKLNNGKECLAKSVGFASGMFEIKSLLGDNYDINNYLGSFSNRIQLTASTIKDIEIVKSNILGQLL